MDLTNNPLKKIEESHSDYDLYHNIFEEATDAIFIGDKSGNFVKVNSGAEKLTGYKKAELSTMRMADLFPTKVLEKEPLDYNGIASGKTITAKRKIEKKDGSIVFVEMKSKMLSDGNLISIISDISAKNLLQHTELKYNEIIENIKESLVILQDGKLKFANSITAKLLGYPLSEIIDKPFLDFVFPDDRDLIKSNYNRRLNNENSVLNSYEFRMLSKTGKAIWMETNPIVTTFEEKPAIQAFMIDISEKKKAQLALEKSEYKYRAIIENSLEAILVMRDFKLLFYNTALIKLFKLDPNNLSGIDISQFIFPADLETTANYYRQRLKGIEVPNQYPIRIYTTEGKLLWVELKAIIIDWPGGPASMVFLNDITEKKNAQIALTNSESKFKSLVENMEEGIVTVNLNSKIQYASLGLLKIIGYSKEELVGKNFSQFIYKDDLPYILNRFSEVINNKLSPSEYRIVAKDGTVIWIRSSSTPIYEDGKVAGLNVLVINLNSRKIVEESLRDSERKYREMIENSPIGILIHHYGSVVYVNSALKMMAGYASDYDDFTGKSLLDFVLPEYHQKIKERIKFIMETKSKSELTEAKLISRSGKHIDVLYMGQYLIYDNNPCIQVYVYDVTDFNKIQTSVNTLSHAVSQSSSVIVISNAAGMVEYANSAFEKVTGITLSEIIGTGKNLFKSLQISRKTFGTVWRQIKSGKEWKGELPVYDSNGETRILNIVVSPIRDTTGIITHFVSIGEDITDEKEIEKNLEITKNSAKNTEQLKSNFLAQMSHEIRTPINAIVSFTGLLKNELFENLDEDQKISFDMIEKAGTRIIRTIELLLNYSELKTMSYEMSMRRIDLNSEIILKSFLEYKRLAEAKNIKFSTNNSIEDSFVYCDRHSLEQIISNLIDNAIKYTDTGSVEIKLFRNEEDKLSVKIADTGKGIASNYLEDIFNPFSQEEEGYTRSFEGNGLGLALVKEYCEMNNIGLSVESEKGEGTTFKLVFEQ